MQDSQPSRKREAGATAVVAGGNQEVREGVWPAVGSEGCPDVRSRAVLAFILRTMKTRKVFKHESNSDRKACWPPSGERMVGRLEPTGKSPEGRQSPRPEEMVICTEGLVWERRER